jgi:hypothetical protein
MQQFPLFNNPPRHNTKRSGAIIEKHLSLDTNDDEEVRRLKGNIRMTGDDKSLSSDLKIFLRQITYIPSIYDDDFTGDVEEESK